MKKTYQLLLVASVLGLAITAVAAAGKDDCKLHNHKQHMQKGAHMMHMPPPMKPFYLKHITLTNAQEDKIFELTHATVPNMRELMQKQQALREELKMLVQTDQYTNSKARKIAESLAALEHQHVLAKSELNHQIYGVLTDEQKAQVRKMEKQRPSHGGMLPAHPHHTGLNNSDIRTKQWDAKPNNVSKHLM